MVKADIIRQVARVTGLEKETAAEAVEVAVAAVRESLLRGENVYLRGFGTFEVRTRASKPAQDMNRHRTIILPERRVAVFRPGTRLRDLE